MAKESWIGKVWAAATHPNRVDCAQFVAQLDDYLDRALSPEEAARLEEHLVICHRCLQLHRFEAKVIEQLRQKVQKIQAPPQLKQSILEKLKETDNL